MLEHGGLRADQVAQHRALDQRLGEHRRQLLGAAVEPRPAADGRGQFGRELREPLAHGAGQQLEQHGLARVEVAQDVGLGQAHPPAELVEREVGDRHLLEHRGRGVEDRLAAQRALLVAAGALEGRGHGWIVQTGGLFISAANTGSAAASRRPRLRRAGRQQQPRHQRADREHRGGPGEGRGVAVDGGLRGDVGRGAVADAYAPAALAASVLSSAVPIEPPTCWPVLTSAEATPASAPLDAARRGVHRRGEDQAQADADHEQARQHVGARSSSRRSRR